MMNKTEAMIEKVKALADASSCCAEAKEMCIRDRLIAISFAASYLAEHLPGISSISSGTRTIILTVVLSSAAAILFPHPAEDSEIEVQEENQKGKNNSSAGAAKQGA